MPEIPTIRLNNGVDMPQLGYGVFQIPEAETTEAVTAALQAGYRSIDTAAAYGNEEGVGKAIAGFPREQLFITTKLWNSDQGYDETLRAFEKSVSLLGLDYLDLYLIHWPAPAQDRYVGSWKALIRLADEGRISAIGVSNFQPAHLERIINETGRVPAVNQVELHPFLQQSELREVHAKLGIATEAWSPLGQGGELLTNPAITAVAEKHGRTAAQVVLRWHLQLGNVVIPKSVTPSRIAENIDVFGFVLDESDLTAVSTLDMGHRIGPDPDHFA
ncbi:2,5-diketo-D-gluconate reductase A [Kibdelosporangium banguiense]|uniref:2,5-diketo-D-gluconate reductase A n=1 Tax=Kibdelosporangium banguiense TaxID=1365924 RepID=A0ABS4TZQ7_9PSEU|nr:aldo/keto reductase [Kibdelosporangium banguiense]MBP2329893.1 2,5-diketo-D-gluconate reductase A [Kibdelosporangium banguiense]